METCSYVVRRPQSYGRRTVKVAARRKQAGGSVQQTTRWWRVANGTRFSYTSPRIGRFGGSASFFRLGWRGARSPPAPPQSARVAEHLRVRSLQGARQRAAGPYGDRVVPIANRGCCGFRMRRIHSSASRRRMTACGEGVQCVPCAVSAGARVTVGGWESSRCDTFGADVVCSSRRPWSVGGIATAPRGRSREEAYRSRYVARGRRARAAAVVLLVLQRCQRHRRTHRSR